ncbi:MAG TPA: hypothetical protein VHL52_13105 [Acidimicrobiia bacterium]|nr:hypothetical protein [Acidimicrobiia bacterium]
MSILKNIEGTASNLLSQVGPVGERVRDTADEVIEYLGTESRQLGEKMGERLSAQLEQVPEATLKRLNLVTTSKSRRRTILATLIGLVLGAAVMKLVMDQQDRRRQDDRTRSGWEEPTPAVAVTGELPQ